MIKVNFTPSIIQFVSSQFTSILAVADSDKPLLRLIKAESSLVEKKNEATQVVLK